MENQVIFTLCAFLVLTLYYPVIGLTPEEATSNSSINSNSTYTTVKDPTVVPSVKHLSSSTPETIIEVPTFENPTDTIHTTGHAQVSTVSSHIPTQPNISLSLTTPHPKKADSASTTAIPNPATDESLPENKTTSFTATSASQTSSASSPIQPNEDQSVKPSPETTVSPELQSQTSSPAHHHSTSTQPSNPSTQAKVRAETPSQLNVGGDAATVVHEATSVDPLLAALVSAFVVAAAIITLLVFLKLRRRDNRPEFRRLQDLPMDDMMEEAPLSMHTY